MLETRRFFSLTALLVVFFIAATACPANSTGFINIKSSSRQQKRDPEVCILSEKVTIEVHNQMVKTRVLQIFRNSTGRILEGDYVFPLPYGANIVSFATWDDGVKINGIILEKAKAKKIYEDIVRQLKDPGLLENIGSNTFHARIFPIPPYGTKRLELEYVEYLPLRNGCYSYTYPLHSAERASTSRSLSIEASITSDMEVSSPVAFFKNCSFARDGRTHRTSHMAEAFADDVDFKFSYSLTGQAASGGVFVYRPSGTSETYFLLNFRPFEVEKAPPAVNDNGVTWFLIDTSYSMKGEKLRTVEKLFEKTDSLDGASRVGAIFFDSSARDVFGGAVPAGQGLARLRAHLARARAFSEARPAAALSALFAAVAGDSSGAPHRAYLISDGQFDPAPDGRTIESVISGEIDSRPAAARRLTLSAIGVGNDCQNDRLSQIAGRLAGEFVPLAAADAEQVSSCIARMARSATAGLVRGVRFASGGMGECDVYPRHEVNVGYDSECYAVGRTGKAGPLEVVASYSIAGAQKSRGFQASGDSGGAWYIPLLWARERVDFLVSQIDKYGENEAMRKEIVELSKRFCFVTRYTSFLAVPPSVLRPRRIKPGDPEVLVSAPRDSRMVVVTLPFGDPVRAFYEEARGAFVARFTVPAHLRDGEYDAVILVVDRFGRERHENASFTVDSTPPEVFASCRPAMVFRGGLAEIRVNASRDTASINAKLPGGRVICVSYDPVSKLSLASFRIGAGEPAGEKGIEIEAIDHAGNRTVRTVKYTVSVDSPAGEKNERL